jgi:hypothetical protein
VWPGEREALAVWADELQTQGEALGELIATYLRADDIRRHGDAERAAALASEAERLRISMAQQLLGPAVGELSRLRLRWQYGVVRAIHLDRSPDPDPAPQVVLEVVVKLLRRPVTRFLDQLHLEAVAPDIRFARALLDELARGECVARPRRVLLGRMPGHVRRLFPFEAPWSTPWHGPGLLKTLADRGLTWLGRWGWIQALPWTTGDHGSRLQQLEHMLDGPWQPSHGSAITQALWDTSLRVRRRALAALPELGDEAAPALLAALAIARDSQRTFGDLVERSVTRIAATRPSWVAAVAEEFSLAEPWVARWLAGVGRSARPAARRAVPRIEAMLGRLARVTASHDYRAHGLRLALEHFGGPGSPPAIAEDETIAELVDRHTELRRA